MFTRLFPSADFGGKERRLIFDGPQNTPEQSFAEQVEANLPNLENNLDSPLKAQAVAEIKVALAEKDANVMKKGIENALANIARTEFALLKEKHQGDEKAAAAELQADFRTIGLVNVEKRDDGTFYVSVIVPGAQNAPPNFNAPQQAPGAPGAPSAKPANALEAPKDIPEEKLEGLSDEQKEVLREGYKLLPPEAQKVMIELLKSQEAVQGMLSLAPKIAADPSMIPKLMKVSEAEYQNPDTIKDPALQNLVKGLSAGDRRLLSALFRVLQ
ncbi:hypothetical protein HYZ99_02965, partial [Candidatus Peregrinibacteria bacterium]|nr:hypothetical protein [Candidatus Peregrinibacteria bacterium]